MVNQYPLPREKRETPELKGNGGAVYGPFSFRIFDVADVVVEVKRPGGAWQIETVLVEKVNTAAAFDYFTIEFDEAIGGDVSFRVRGVRLHERLSELTRGGVIIVDEMEKEASKQGVVLQELRRDYDKIGDAVHDVEAGALAAALHAATAEVARDEAVVAKQAAEAAAGQAEAIAGFDPALYLQKSGGTMSGKLTVTAQLTAQPVVSNGTLRIHGGGNIAYFYSDGGMAGNIWWPWGSVQAKTAIGMRIDTRAAEIADAKIAAALDGFAGSQFHTIEMLTSGQINWPDWVQPDTPVHVMAWGGGAADGWGGGGGGECVAGWFKRGDFINDDVVIGAGGLAKAADADNGVSNDGGNTLVGGIITAQGGYGVTNSHRGGNGGGDTGGREWYQIPAVKNSAFGGGCGGAADNNPQINRTTFAGSSVYGGGGGAGGSHDNNPNLAPGKSIFGGDGGAKGQDG